MKTVNEIHEKEPEAPNARRSWSPMALEALGAVSDLVRGGGGKISALNADEMPNRKPAGQG